MLDFGMHNRIAGLCGLAWLLAAAPPAAAAQTPRNAILITVDTLRADVLGYHGGPAQTPYLDNLAKHSWNFSRCIAASMLTNPAHASIMTSLYLHDHNVYDNDSGIADHVPTLAAALQAQGWHTGALINFGHLNPQVSNLGQGFAQVVNAGKLERRALQTTEAALQLIDQLPEPFFVWLHYTDPHAPYEPGTHAALRPWGSEPGASMAHVAHWAPKFQRDNPWFQRVFRTYSSTSALASRYMAEVENVDAALGALAQGLQSRRLSDRTALVITADHGENFGEHALYFHHGGLYDSTVHVPLLVHVPNTLPAALTGQVASVDIAPTLLDLLGVPAWKPMRGSSLRPYASGQGAARPYTFSEHMFGQQSAVRSATGTLIVHQKNSRQFPSYPFRQGRREVLPQDLDSDAVSALNEALQAYMSAPSSYVARPGPPGNREALRSLGYTE